MTATEIAVFTRNIRVYDNPVLTAAARADRTLPVFVTDPAIEQTGFSNPNRQQWLAEGLADLDDRLRRMGAALLVRHGDPVEEVTRLAEQYDASVVHLAADVSGFAARREQRLDAALREQRRKLVVHDDVATVQPPLSLHPASDDHYKVFTPYFRSWQQASARTPLDPPRRLRLPDGLDAETIERQRAADTGGETAARDRMQQWVDGPMADYEDRHDDLAGDATSKLSPHLHFGFVSPTELTYRASRKSDAGARAFVRQLCWRDFHHQVLAARPGAAWQDYRSRQDQWRTSASELDAWRHGQTGYPLVDAGMRQLAETGWMHNRARMIVASFLTKTLYQDWRTGAQHFLDQLVDGDLANNNLNWQWVAGTGTDTRPNRVLNPLRQASRFDPDAAYVRRWVPELADVADPASAHQPWQLSAADRRALDYPKPIVDLDAARDRFLSHRG